MSRMLLSAGENLMPEIVSIAEAARRRAKKQRAEARDGARGKTLCRRGFHKWIIDQRKQFDVREGKLMTVRRCARCDAVKSSLD